MRRTAWLLVGPIVSAVAAATLGAGPQPAAASPSSARTSPTILGAHTSSAIDGEYLVSVKDSAVAGRGVVPTAQALTSAHHGLLGHVWDKALTGFSVSMSEADAQQLAAEPDVAYVEQNQRWTLAGTVTDPLSWGLDRIDQRSLPLNHAYGSDDGAGAGVHAYIIDSGIRASHFEIEGRVESGWDFIDNDAVAEDCTGHGTQVAGVVGGTRVGVAGKVTLVPLRAFNCQKTSGTTSLVDSVNWVVAHAKLPAVINLSVSISCEDAAGHIVTCPEDTRRTLIQAENTAIGMGIPVVASAGNDGVDACTTTAPLAPDVITVGATNSADGRWVGTNGLSSNFGPCVDIWAPGADILTSGGASDASAVRVEGTSFSAPHVAGAVALLLGTPQFAHASVAQITAQLMGQATPDVLTGLGTGSRNLLLFSGSAVPTATVLGLARNADGRLTFAGLTKTGFVKARTRLSATAPGWGSWSVSTTQPWMSIALDRSQDGRLEMAMLTATGQVWHRQQAVKNSNSWLTLAQLDGLRTSVALAANADGRLTLVAVGSDGQVSYRTQQAANSKDWQAWRLLMLPAGVQMRSVTAATDANGRVEIAGVDSNGHVLHATQTAVNADSWSAFTRLDANVLLSEVALALNKNGTLELVGTDGVGGLWRRSQTGAGAAIWSSWRLALTGKSIVHLCAEAGGNDGRVEIVGVDRTGTLWQTLQSPTDATAYVAWATDADGSLGS